MAWWARRARIAASMALRCRTDLLPRLGAIRYCRQAIEGGGDGGKARGAAGPIWQFWAQEVGQAPALVRACVDSVERQADGRDHRVLDYKSVGDHVDLPGAVHDRIGHWGWTKFSNLLRLALLEEHGGTWVDSTVLFGGRIPALISDAPFFAYRWRNDPRLLATWFLHARAGHPLIGALREAYTQFWLRADNSAHYFAFHHLFEAIVAGSPSLRKIWEDAPSLPASVPHELQSVLMQPFDAAAFAQIMQRSWIQKLTYKQTGATETAGSFLETLGRPGFLDGSDEAGP